MSSGFSPAAVAAFEALFRPWMRRRLHAVRIAGLPQRLPSDHALILAANHVSWWDAFALREVQRRVRPGVSVYTLMREDELRRVPWFRWLGVIGFDPGAAASFGRAVRRLERLLEPRPAGAAGAAGAVLFFPQGRIGPSFGRPLRFRRGVELLARRLAPSVVLPVGLHLEPLRHAAPTLFAAVGDPLGIDGSVQATGVEAAVGEQLDRILAWVAAHGEAAGERWPEEHEPLPQPGGADAWAAVPKPGPAAG